MSDIELFELANISSKAIDDPFFPTELSAWKFSDLTLNDHDTHFGYVFSGSLALRCASGTFSLNQGMYFCVAGNATLIGDDSSGFVASRLNWLGLFQIGGPIEARGRLAYIDGCSDSLLITPPVVGDPCLNLLYLPANTQQTQHTHPSCRVGIVADGTGTCRTPTGDYPLKPGTLFNIPPGARHSFHTTESSMRVIAWHPDTDFGSNHHDHPMINRTIVDGESAATLKSIHSMTTSEARNDEVPQVWLQSEIQQTAWSAGDVVASFA